MPTATDLEAIEAEFLAKHGEYSGMINRLPLASSDRLDPDTEACIIAEGAFMRFFTLWEMSIQRSFIHYCSGGQTLNNIMPACRLQNCDEALVKKILVAGYKYLDWSDPGYIRDRALTFFEEGIPFHNPLIGKAQVLSHARKIRNVIAHDSPESWNSYAEVQRHNFTVERNFPISPGQLLRVRAKGRTKTWGEFYLDEIAEAFAAVLRPES